MGGGPGGNQTRAVLYLLSHTRYNEPALQKGRVPAMGCIVSSDMAAAVTTRGGASEEDETDQNREREEERYTGMDREAEREGKWH